MLENMGERHCVFTASMLGQEAALHVSRVQIGPPGEAVENNFNAACGLRPLLSTWTRFLDCYELPVVPYIIFQLFQILVNSDEFRRIQTHLD